MEDQQTQQPPDAHTTPIPTLTPTSTTPPNDKVKTKVHCEHGNRSRNCRECKHMGVGGADLCDSHFKYKYLCFQCFDEGRNPTSICEHRQNHVFDDDVEGYLNGIMI
ncbi:hypothetical protein HDU67_002405 [Dinochytrium kinnereticum]|nr:hypothetical protein HDU67_002405 [Dinochytrium kinnereticum]